MDALLIVGYVLAGIAGLIHIYIWVMESITWGRPATWKRFGIRSQDEADTIKPMALNQGFYNLFLAIGVAVGVVAQLVTYDGGAITVFACLCMVGAALVLVISNPKLARAAALQGVIPLVAVVLMAIWFFTQASSAI